MGPTHQREVQMVEITSRKPVMVFQVFDRNGQPIGEVVQPKVMPVVGRGARTVLLVRSDQVPARTRCCASSISKLRSRTWIS
jgi:hypothetical protein